MAVKCCGRRIPTAPLLLVVFMAGYEVHDFVHTYKFQVTEARAENNRLQAKSLSYSEHSAAGYNVVDAVLEQPQAASAEKTADYRHRPTASTTETVDIGSTEPADGNVDREAALGRVCYTVQQVGRGCTVPDQSGYSHINLWEAQADCSRRKNCTAVVRTR